MADNVVLVVDDDESIRDLIQGVLEAELHLKTIAAEDGEQALRQVANAAPSLVVLDLNMPVLDGFGVIGHLKADSSTKDIPIVVVSAGERGQAAMAAGCSAFVPKPFDLDLLVETVEKHMPVVKPLLAEQTLAGVMRVITALTGEVGAAYFLRRALLAAARKHPELALTEHAERELTLALSAGCGSGGVSGTALGAVTASIVDVLSALLGLKLTAALLGDPQPRSSV